MKRRSLLLLSLFILIGHFYLNAQVVEIAQYNDPPSSGTLAGIPFTISGTVFDPPLFFNAGGAISSLCSSPESLQGLAVGQDENWSITFDQPIENLKLYLLFWRGPGNSNSGGTFSEAGTLLSGSGINLSGDGTTVSTTSFWRNGLIEFPGPITTLGFAANSSNRSGIGINFGISDGEDCGSPGGGGEPVAETPEDLPAMPNWQLALMGILVLLTVGAVSFRKLF